MPFYVITLGNTIGNSPFLGLANYGGIIFLTFFAALINILMAAIILKFDKNLGLLKNRFSAILAIIAIALFLAGWQFSQSNLQKNSNDYNSRQKILKTAVLSNNEKFDEEFLIFKENTFSEDEKKLAEAMILDKLKLIRTDIIGKNIDILVFPEDMIDIEIWNNADKQAFEKFNISNAGILISSYGWLAKELNTYLAATITTIRNGKRYNSTILFDRNGELIDISDKSILTITSEWWPFEKWYPFYYNWFLKTAPDINKNIALFNKKYNYEWGRKKLLKTGDFEFASLICIETHYPNEFKKSMELGAEFIINSSNSRWVPSGLNHYLYLTTNLRKIESVWQNVPIIINGRDEKAGIITPDGKTDLINFESGSENYGLFVGEVGY